MNMDIQYEGCTAQPDDRLSADGQLDAALDLVPENGTLKPFVQPASAGTLTLTDTQKLFVHQTAEYTHYLVADTSDGVTLSWAASLDDTELAEIATLDGQEFLSLVCIGNTVVVSASTQLAYFLWRAADGAYVYLGDRVPDPKIQFALKSHLVTKTYEDTGITTTSTTSTNTTADGTWTDVASAIGTGPPTTGEGTAIVAAMDSDFTIEAGTQYRVCIEWITGKWEGAGAVWGTNSSGTACTLFAWTYNSACVPFSVTADYTDIEVRVVSFRTGVTTTYRAYIQQGATAVEGRVVEYNEENYNALMARMNKYVQDQAVDKGRFIYPFFVRYAVRMFDGSHSYVSPPALMIPNTGFVPFLFFYYGASSGDIKASAFTADLQYMIGEEIEEEWEDVIDGVDIYISQPIYPYDQSAEYDEGETLLSYGQYNSTYNTLEGYNHTVGTVFAGDINVSDLVEDENGSAVAGHRKRDLFRYLQEYNNYFSSASSDGQWNVVQPAKFDDDEMEKKYKSVSAFYRIKAMTLSDMASDSNEVDDEGFITLELADGVLDSLVTQTALSEDTIALTAVTGAGLYAYNNRLHVFGAATKYVDPPNPIRLNNYMTPVDKSSEDWDSLDCVTVTEAWVYVKTTQGERCACVSYSDGNYYESGCFQWYLYPDPRAYKLVLHRKHLYYSEDDQYTGEAESYQEIPLKTHDFLSGAYAFSPPSSGITLHGCGDTDTSAPTDVPDDTLLRASTIYVSEPSNPFAFTAASAVSVGAERVYALAAAARALSQGQFEQFPLYAFTSEGVWALETADTGVYTARQPITRDVCTNAGSITQLDTSVLFVTDKGVMEVSDSQSQCISLAVDNIRTRSAISSLQGIDTLLGLAGIETAAMTPQAFREYVKGCGVVYDSSRSRVFIFNTSYPYTYVIDMASQRWGMVSTLIREATNSYPEALAVLQDGSIVNFSEDGETDYVSCALLTRPVKFGSPDTLKTVRAVIQRGVFPLSVRSSEETPDNPPVRQALYGSRDLLNWHLVASSRHHIISAVSGSGYRYFRVAAVFHLQPEDCVTGFSAEVIPRQTNRIR